jgi:ABC-2 type transport system permease protein
MIRETYALTVRELKHWYRAKIQIFMTFIQPLMWLALFGQAFQLPLPPAMMGGAPNYFSYMAVGMLAVTTLFTCMFAGMSIVWDRRFGFLNKLRVAPIPRGSIPVSRIMASTIRALISGLIVFFIAILFCYIPGLTGLTITGDFGVLGFLGMVVILFLLALAFAAIFVSIALTVRNQETLFGVINLLNLPLMFASAALFPISQMPDWLKAVAQVNPLTLAVDGIRQMMFANPAPINALWVDVLGLIVFAGVFVALGIFVSMRALKEK